jgi:predicted DNA-binding antitoxin AbrB/MazE fold protein
VTQVIQAIYEDGVFKPVEVPNLPEHQQVRIVVQDFSLPKKTLADLYGLLATEKTPPNDAEVEAMLDEYRQRKYG